ncbi:ATP-binding protein [Streptomyces sp. NPDC046275]|uniref:ATP-binding protein n=1 Tax=Streptomyces sp. NPDC046275 TaxID=3157201 RepID=UPI0033FC08FA
MAERAVLIVAELAANAVLHGRVRGRDFQVGLAFGPVTGALRLTVTDTRGERLPILASEAETVPPDRDSGRGLLLVAALADRWGVEPYAPSGKTVWAEIGAPFGRVHAPVSSSPEGRGSGESRRC